MPFQVTAVNTAAESENKIHDDAVAAAYGFQGALVPGVTLYGYLATAVLEHFGEPWLHRGAMEIRFRRPVYEGDRVSVALRPEGDRVVVDAGEIATAVAWLHSEEPASATFVETALERRPAAYDTLAPGTVLGSLKPRLNLSQAKMSAPLDPALGRERYAHPAILLALANDILVRNYLLGPWIHAASEVRNFSPVRDGEEVSVHATIEDRFEKKGHEFVVLDVVMLAQGRWIERVRHTAIWRPRQV